MEGTRFAPWLRDMKKQQQWPQVAWGRVRGAAGCAPHPAAPEAEAENAGGAVAILIRIAITIAMFVMVVVLSLLMIVICNSHDDDQTYNGRVGWSRYHSGIGIWYGRGVVLTSFRDTGLVNLLAHFSGFQPSASFRSLAQTT